MKRNTYIILIVVISVDKLAYDYDNHVNKEIILWGWIIYDYSPLGSASKSQHFNGTFNIKQTPGKIPVFPFLFHFISFLKSRFIQGPSLKDCIYSK